MSKEQNVVPEVQENGKAKRMLATGKKMAALGLGVTALTMASISASAAEEGSTNPLVTMIGDTSTGGLEVSTQVMKTDYGTWVKFTIGMLMLSVVIGAVIGVVTFAKSKSNSSAS